MRVYRLNIKVNNKFETVVVNGINMIQLVAQCNRSNTKCIVYRIK